MGMLREVIGFLFFIYLKYKINILAEIKNAYSSHFEEGGKHIHSVMAKGDGLSLH